jgi:membrane protein implicated in regulation of membrane protease activity
MTNILVWLGLIIVVIGIVTVIQESLIAGIIFIALGLIAAWAGKRKDQRQEIEDGYLQGKMKRDREERHKGS